LEAELQQMEAATLSLAKPAEPVAFDSQRARIEGLEEPCRRKQAEFYKQQEAYHEQLNELQNRKGPDDPRLMEQIAENSRDLAAASELIIKLNELIQNSPSAEGAAKDNLDTAKTILQSLTAKKLVLDHERERLANERVAREKVAVSIQALKQKFDDEQTLFHLWLQYYQARIYAAFG